MIDRQDNEYRQMLRPSMNRDIERMLVNKDEIIVPGDLEVFRGHFPGNPIVPAIYTLELAVRCARAKSGGQGELIRIDRCKFNRPIGPGMRIRTETKISPGPDASANQARIVFRNTSDDQVVASLQLVINA